MVRDLYRRDKPTAPAPTAHGHRRLVDDRWSRLARAMRRPWFTPFEVTVFGWLGLLALIMMLTAFTWRIGTR